MNPDHMIAFGFYFVLKWTLGFDQSAKDCSIGLQQHVHNSRIANIIFFISLNLIQIWTFYKLEFTKCSSLCFTAHSECFLATRSQCVAQIFQPCPRLRVQVQIVCFRHKIFFPLWLFREESSLHLLIYSQSFPLFSTPPHTTPFVKTHTSCSNSHLGANWAFHTLTEFAA